MQMNPVTIGVVGGSLVVLLSVIVYVESREEPKEPQEEYERDMIRDMDNRFNGINSHEYDANKGIGSVSVRGGKMNRRKTKKTKRT